MDKIKRILIIQTAFLGDVVLTIPLVMAVKKAFPDSYLSVMVTPAVKEILENNPAIDEIIVFDKKGKDRSWPAFWKLAAKIKAHNFNVALLPHRSFKSVWLCFLARIPKRIGFNISAGSFLLTAQVPYGKSKNIHEIDRNLDLLKPLGVKDEKSAIFLDPGPEAVNYALEFCNDYEIKAGDLVIGINPGSVWPTKRYATEKYAALADRLIQGLKATVIIIGSPADVPVADKMAREMRETAINLAGRTTISQITAVMKRFNLLVSNDSGAMHIAVALGVPVVAIFGPTTQDFGFFPYSTKDLVVEKDLPCRPCGKHGGMRCPKNNFLCLKLITVSDVFDAVKRRLAG
ncbi:MAG: lipopolysaccharide heptosyltransferase II [Elusimicrobia bacterium]|nr:lipopolysaccharide heptosyltransferase II [Elusimicrobiota bacterium]